MAGQSGRLSHVRRVITEMYGTELVNAKKVLNTKLSKTKPNPDNLTLAERILLNRQKGQKQALSRRDSGSVDISDLTNQNEERRTPTPEPTRANRSPIKRQDTKRSINTAPTEPQPGPSNRHSATPPLPPIKSASPKPKSETPRNSPALSRQSRAQSRRETPVLPPIPRKESRAESRREPSRTSVRSEEGVQPPKDTRGFDPDLGVGEEEKIETPTPLKEEQKADDKPADAVPREPIPKRVGVAKTPEPQSEARPKKERSPEKPKSPDKSAVVPVAAAVATTSQRAKSRSKSRSRSRSRKSRSMSRSKKSRSRSRSKSPLKARSGKRSKSRSRSHSRTRKKSRNRSTSRSRSRSRSHRRSRRSRSRKRHRSTTSYSSSSSPRRRRRHSASSSGGHRRKERSRSRRGSFDFDFERAKSIIRSLSRMDTFSRPRHRSPSIEYTILGGNSGFWPTPIPDSSRKKKKIIIVQNGATVQPTKRRSQSSSDSDISVVVKNVKSTPRGRKGKVRKVSESEESDSSVSKSRERAGKKNRKTKRAKSESDSESSDSEIIVKNKKKSKGKKDQPKSGQKKKNIRFDLNKDSKGKKKDKKSKTGEDVVDNESGEEENQPAAKLTQKPFAVVPKKLKSAPVEEAKDDVHAVNRLPTPDSPLPTPNISRGPTPLSNTPQNGSQRGPTPARNTPQNVGLRGPTPAKNTPRSSQRGPTPRNENRQPTEDDDELMKALEQLDKRSDFELEQLKGGSQRKLPPDVNLDMKKKIFSKEFQENINNFLES